MSDFHGLFISAVRFDGRRHHAPWWGSGSAPSRWVRRRRDHEIPYARWAAEAVGARHHEVVVSAEELVNSLPRLVWHEDERGLSLSDGAQLSLAACETSSQVVLTGGGLDELFRDSTGTRA